MEFSHKEKIFGIGLNKTGTTTLGECGKILGYRCISCDRNLLKDVVIKQDFSRVKDAVDRHDFFEDWPWPLIYKDLDEMFPESKFILTVRKNSSKWLNSLKNHSLRTNPFIHCRKYAYSYNFPHRYEQKHLDFYKRHNDSVRNHFKNRKNDFIEICWERDDGWRKLCTFLDKPIPEMPLPHAKKGEEERTNKVFFLINRILSLTGL